MSPTHLGRFGRACIKRRRRLLLLAVATLALAFGILWNQGLIQTRFQTWLQKRVIARYIQKIQPSLPFRIERFDIEPTPWKKFRAGNISKLNIKLNWNSWRVSLSGPVHIGKADEKGEISARFDANVTVEPEQNGDAKGARSDSAKAVLWVQVPKNLSKLTELGATIHADSFNWPYLGLQTQGLHFEAGWRGVSATAQIRAQTVNWTQDEQHALSIEKPSVEFTAPLTLEPFQLGPRVSAHLSANNSEILWDDLYLSPPLSELPVDLHADLNAQLLPKTIEAYIGNAKHPKLSLFADLTYTKNQPTDAALRWKVSDLELKQLAQQASQLPQLSAYSGIQVLNGNLNSQGQARVRFKDLAVSKLTGHLDLGSLNLKWPEKGLLIKNLNFNLRLPDENQGQGAVSIENLFVQRFRGKMAETKFGLKRGKTITSVSFDKGLGLQLDRIPLQFGPLHASIQGTEYRISTSLKLAPTPVQVFTDGLCLSPSLIPPATFQIDLPEIDISPDAIDPTGTAQVNLFDGQIKISEMGMYDYMTATPEIDFSAEWDKIDVGKLAEWLHFGRIDGLLVGHAKDVTFQSWLPTQYDFRMELKPHHASDIVFSPLAMKNFVKIIVGEDIDRLPGAAQWVAFGWPRDVIGGYDVNCAGISVFSAEGNITIEALPCQEVLKDPQSHFILYDFWFRMPLNATHYPLTVDATAMSEYVRRFAKRVGLFTKQELPQERGQASSEENNHANQSCLHPEFSK